MKIPLKIWGTLAAALLLVGLGALTLFQAYGQIEHTALARNEVQFQKNLQYLFAVLVIASLLTVGLTLVFAWLLYQNAQHQLKNQVHLKTLQLLAVQNETNQLLEQGKIGATSEVGAGSIFWIELPHDPNAHSDYIKAAKTEFATLPLVEPPTIEQRAALI